MNQPRSAGDRFDRLLAEPAPDGIPGSHTAPELGPSRWARAAAGSLGVDGAALSLHDHAGLHTPLGSSDPVTTLAEQLQFTYGVGPSIRAHDTGQVIAFDEDDIARNWPQLHGSLVERTPLRAVFSTPLLPPLGPLIVLDLYTRDPDEMRGLDRDAVEEVVVRVTRAAIQELMGPGSTGAEIEWWRSPDALRRGRVWQAMGQVAVRLQQDTSDALAVLRAHAVGSGRVLDDVADEVLSGTLDVRELAAAPHPD